MTKEKQFEFMNKYYTFSKKWIPLCLLCLFLILALCKVSTTICLCVYFGLLLAHLGILAVLNKLIKKHIVNVIKDSEGSENVFQQEK